MAVRSMPTPKASAGARPLRTGLVLAAGDTLTREAEAEGGTVVRDFGRREYMGEPMIPRASRFGPAAAGAGGRRAKPAGSGEA